MKINLENKTTALSIFILLSTILLFPIFKNIDYIGSYDWDQHFFYNAVPRVSLLKYHEFPLWNPYYCGGDAMLAHPESSFLSPTYLFILLFGEIIGLKMLVFLHLVVGMFGMFLLAKYFRLEKYSSYLPPIIFFFSSWFASRIIVGHTLYLTLAFLPYVFLYFLKSLKKQQYIIICAIFLSLIILGGGATYPFLYSLILLFLYSFFILLKRKKKYPILILFFLIVVASLFSAVKIVPMYFFVKDYSLVQDDMQPNNFKNLYYSLLSRNQDVGSRVFYSYFNQTQKWYDDGRLINGEVHIKTIWQWHEYSAYIGIIPVILFLIALIFYFRRYWILLSMSFVFLILFFGDKLILWSLIRKIPFLSSLHGPSRFIILFVFALSLISGMVLSRVERIKKYSIIAPIMVLIICLDLAFISIPLYSGTFDQKMPNLIKKNDNYFQVLAENKFISKYPNFLQGIGTVNCYERVHPPTAVYPAYDESGNFNKDYLGEVFFAKSLSKVEYEFSTNKIKASFDIDKPEIIVLNQNYDKGWKSNSKDVKNFNGLVSTDVGPEEKEIEFYYLPNSFVIGLIISLISLISGIVYFIRKR